MTLVIEVLGADGWQLVGKLQPGDPVGSLAHHPPQGGREIIMFTCHDEHSVVERSIGGSDVEHGHRRDVAMIGSQELARLEPEDTYELDVRTDRMTSPRRLRFRHEEVSA